MKNDKDYQWSKPMTAARLAAIEAAKIRAKEMKNDRK